MAWSDTYPKIVAALIAKNGQWAPGIPKLKSADAIGTLAAYVGSLRAGIERAADGIAPSIAVTGEGVHQVPSSHAFDPLAQKTISVAGYISKCTPVAGNAWKRFAPDQPYVTSWEPYRDPSYVRDEQTEQIYLVREAMDKYQSALNAISIGATISDLAGDGTWRVDPCKIVMQKLRLLGSELDNMGANPPTTLSDDVKGALHDATTASEGALKSVAKGAGKVAGELGNVAGDIAANFAQGFLAQASLVTIAGVVAFIAYKRFF